MQINDFTWETYLVILTIYLGFAGAWGMLVRRSFRFKTWISVGFGLFIILPASLGLPFGAGEKVLAWGAALGIASLFYLKPANAPAWLWQPLFFFCYCGFVMFLIMAWSILAAGAGNPPALLWLGLPAGVAGCLAIVKACRAKSQRGTV